MSGRADERRLRKYTRELGDVILARLSSDEFQEILAVSDAARIDRSETLTKFFTTQYSIVTREVAAVARADGCEALFKTNASDLFTRAYRAVIGSVYGDMVAEAAVQEALRQAASEMNDPGGPMNPGPLLIEGSGVLLELERDLQADIWIRAHGECCVMTMPETGDFVDYFRWERIDWVYLPHHDPENLLIRFKPHRALSAPVSNWRRLCEEQGLEFRSLGP